NSFPQVILAILVFLAPTCVGDTLGQTTQPQTRREVAHLKFTLDSDGDIRASPDAKTVLVNTRDHRLEIINLSEPKAKVMLPGFRQSPHIFWSPNSDRFMTVTHEKTAIVWDTQSGKKLLELEGSAGLLIVEILES